MIGCECVVCQSTDLRDRRLRSSLAITTDNITLIIDVGPDFRQQVLRSGIDKLDAILVTHEHNDHVAGLDDIRPFNYKQAKALQLYTSHRAAAELRHRFGYIFAKSTYPGAPKVDLIEVKPYQTIDLQSIAVEVLPVYHGDLMVLAYRIGKFTYVTDANQIPDETLSRIRGSEILVLNALHHKKHHSHFNLDGALEMAAKVGADKTFFTHISHHMGFHREVSASLPEGVFLAYDGMELNIT